MSSYARHRAVVNRADARASLGVVTAVRLPSLVGFV
jgi:hypothetical protein